MVIVVVIGVVLVVVIGGVSEGDSGVDNCCYSGVDSGCDSRSII